jgi:hypothetical protein
MENQQIPYTNNEIIAINIFQKPSKYITLDSLMHLDNNNWKKHWCAQYRVRSHLLSIPTSFKF